MHNITKIKLFRILLWITYLPSLIILYPLAKLRKKSVTGLFFFFDRFSMGGAQRIHLDILKSIPEVEKQVFFTRFSPNPIFRKEFYQSPKTTIFDIHIWCDYLLFRLFSVHYFSFYINRHSTAQVFSANSTFFYDMLPFIKKPIVRTELLHNFTFGKQGMEYFGLQNYQWLDHRIVYDFFTRENIKNQYAEYNIPSAYLKRILFFEPGVDLPQEIIKPFTDPLKIVCAGRGGSQKRIGLISQIAEYFMEHRLPFEFHFAGTLIDELAPKVRSKSILHGNISDPDKMSALLDVMDIALLTSAYEGFPMFIKESMAHSCIPVATALPGNLMHLEDRVNALLIPNLQDENEIVKSAIQILEELSANKNLCRQISSMAYHYAKNNFSREKFNKSYRALLLPLV
jgi:glycosyltransferase involved in cell wall biosynthesis